MTCAATGPISIKDFNKIRGYDGHEVFSERKSVNLFQNKVWPQPWSVRTFAFGDGSTIQTEWKRGMTYAVWFTDAAGKKDFG